MTHLNLVGIHNYIIKWSCIFYVVTHLILVGIHNINVAMYQCFNVTIYNNLKNTNYIFIHKNVTAKNEMIMQFCRSLLLKKQITSPDFFGIVMTNFFTLWLISIW
ncbi:hypothetical protein T190115A13A_270001 [Tenacibaculum sp. 190524A02b]|uniref:Uncharacterized protein n=1 Tax=Tenacibaculum vairaonense TaxID=3137860 RepID=A0ABP1FDS1_9FLAO